MLKQYRKQFGGEPSEEDLKRYAQSPNWKDGKFQNANPDASEGDMSKLPQMLYKTFTKNRGIREPKAPLPVLPFHKNEFLAESAETKMIWYGHSAMLLRMSRKNILIDPMLGPNCSPIAPFATKRFSENTLDFIDQFPDIDLVLFTHDHYDHIDLASVEKLMPKTKRFFTSLGVKRHLTAWGVPKENVIEFDWWDEQQVDDIKITLTPTQHFSGRGLSDRGKSFWGGWALNNGKENIWFSGDGGYGTHFKEIGQRLGPFDFAMMECGQYSEDWHDIHLLADESAVAAIDAGVKHAMPVHWAGFNLSYDHAWSQPPEDFLAKANELGLPVSFPKIGELFTKSTVTNEQWWKEADSK